MLKSICFFLFFLSSLSLFSLKEDSKIKTWSGHSVRATLGSTFDFELELRKGTGLPAEALLRYGYEYAHEFNSGFYLSGELDWTIIYPRNFDFPKSGEINFLVPPASLWYVPLTNVQIGYAFNENWLATAGLVYYWAMSNSLRYRFNQNFFLELSSVIWMDRIFNTGGFYGGGLDNLLLSFGVGYKF